LQERVGCLLKRPVGRPSVDVRRSYANFTYRAGSWTKPRRVVAKVEWHPGELYPRVGFIVTNMARPAANVVAFYNKRGTCEQWIKEGKGAIRWTRLSCRSFAANAVRLQLHALAYNLGNFLRTLATPEPIKDWSLTSLKEKLIKIGAKVVSHGRYVAFQMAEVAIPRNLFADILRLIAELRRRQSCQQREAFGDVRSSKPKGEVRLDLRKVLRSQRSTWLRRASALSADGSAAVRRTVRDCLEPKTVADWA
jgi:Transposase DDE domain group 1